MLRVRFLDRMKFLDGELQVGIICKLKLEQMDRVGNVNGAVVVVLFTPVSLLRTSLGSKLSNLALPKAVSAIFRTLLSTSNFLSSCLSSSPISASCG